MIADTPTYDWLCLVDALAMQIGFTASLNAIGCDSSSIAV